MSSDEDQVGPGTKGLKPNAESAPTRNRATQRRTHTRAADFDALRRKVNRLASSVLYDEGKASMVREMNNEWTGETEAEVKQNVSAVLEGNQGRPHHFLSVNAQVHNTSIKNP